MWMEYTCSDLETVIEKLNEMIPLSGPCEKKYTKNKKLDRFRRAQNVIHDIFNNGLCNRGKELKMFKSPMGGALTSYELGISQNNTDWVRIERLLEPQYREIVMDAVLEQFGRQGYLDVAHNRSSQIISKAVAEGRV